MAEQNCLPAGHPPVEGYEYCAGSDQGSDDSNNNTDSDSQGCLPPGHVPVDGYDYCTGDETDSDSDSQSTQNTVLYNTTTHESVSTSNLDGSGWTLLDPERFPDYTHPAYYNTTKHFAIDSSAGSTNQGWILTAGRGADTNKGNQQGGSNETSNQSLKDLVLYNTTTHESVSTSNLDGSGWMLLDPERFPDYTHPAYYNTTKHFAIDSSAGSTDQGWILTEAKAEAQADPQSKSSSTQTITSDVIQSASAKLKRSLLMDEGDLSTITQSSENVIVKGPRLNLHVPITHADKIRLDNSNDKKSILNADADVSGIELEVNVESFQVAGEDILDSKFEFKEGLDIEFVSKAKKISGSEIVMHEGSHKINIENGVIKNSDILTNKGNDEITIGEDVRVKKDVSFDLGEGKDSIQISGGIKKGSIALGKGKDTIMIDGKIKKTTIDLGDDKKKDKVILDSKNNISKKVTLTNFHKRDTLIIGDYTFTYEDLQDETPDKVNVSFRGEEASLDSVSAVVDMITENTSDFL